MKAKQFQDSIREAFLKHFPNGYINISQLALGGGVAIFCGLIGDSNDVANKIRMNDPITFRSYIHKGIKFNDEETELNNLVIEFDGVWVSVLPTNPHLYCESHKIAVRKINAEPGKAIASMDKYFKKLKDTVAELAAAKQIIKQDDIPEKYL